ncbi:MAG: head-tail adaptor protein [Halanaerobiales bacterium]|nr:head-tail adaptor protein [Halanaerobiales bacterium]
MLPNHLFNTTIKTKRSVVSKDSGGSPVSYFDTYLTSVACRVQPLKSDERVQGGRQYSNPSWKVYCDDALDITMDDIVVYDSVEYEVRELDIYPNIYMKLVISK